MSKNQKRAETLFEDSIRLIRAGDYPEALDTLRRSARLATDEKWRNENDVDGKIVEVETYLASSEELYHNWQQSWLAGDWDSAHQTAKQLIERFPLSPRVAELKVPLLVESSPGQCLVRWQPDDEDESTTEPIATPAVLKLPARGTGRLRIDKAGYFGKSMDVDPLTDLRYSVRLLRVPGIENQLDAAPITSPFQQGGDVFVGCDNGRIFAIDSDAQISWRRKLPDLREVAAGPVATGEHVLVISDDRKLMVYVQGQEGEPAMVDLPGQPLATPASYRGIVVVPLKNEAGLLIMHALNIGDQQTRWTREHEGHLVSAPLPCADGFLFSTTGGVVVRIDGRNGDVLSNWRLPGELTDLQVHGERALAATRDGLIFRWNLQAAEPTVLSEAVRGREISHLILDAAALLAVAGSDLYLMSAVSGELEVKRPRVVFGPVVSTDQGIFTMHRLHEVLVLDRKDLRTLESYGLKDSAVYAEIGNGFPLFLGRSGGIYRLVHEE